jgi:predicted butyrate kinase (DUF1464 family)
MWGPGWRWFRVARVVGIDSGTMSMDLLGFDDEDMRVFLDVAIPREEVTRDPGVVVDALLEAAGRVGGLDSIVMSSGYGVPLKRARDASEAEIVEATFTGPGDSGRRLRIHGLRDVIRMLRDSELPVWFTPSVVQLDSVPWHRKANRIDLGTSDKVYSVAAALRDDVELAGVEPGRARFILVEAGYAYTAAILVDGGRIVDGVGGTSGWWGFLGAGFLDAEVAYLLASTNRLSRKETLFRGGVSDLAGTRDLEEFVERIEGGDPRAVGALEALKEAVVKDVASLLASQPLVRRVYVSGRLFRLRLVGEELRGAIREFFGGLGLSVEVRDVTRLGRVTKEAATGPP